MRDHPRALQLIPDLKPVCPVLRPRERSASASRQDGGGEGGVAGDGTTHQRASART